jgi:dienelactone hydrolase
MRGLWRLIKTLWYGFLTLIVVIVLAWGGSVVLRQVDEPTYEVARDWVRVARTKYFRPGHRYRFLETWPELKSVDAAALLRIRTQSDVWSARAELLRAIWGNDGLPVDLKPTRVDAGFQDAVFSEMPEVARIDLVIRETPPGFISRAFHILPRSPNGKLVLFHEGNTGRFHRNAEVIQRFLAEGYGVLAFSMWINDRQPDLAVPGAGKITFIDHEHLKFLDEPHPMRIYFDPIVAGLNAVLETGAYDDVIAVGFSGGGWAVTVYAAMDPRVRLSYPVAGSYPVYLRKYRNWSTWQETYPPMLAAANYLDMYVMASAGEARRQVQVLNQFDGCCYSGVDWQTYADVVRDAASPLGAGWEIYVDSSHADHRFSMLAVHHVLEDIRAHPRP